MRRTLTGIALGLLVSFPALAQQQEQPPAAASGLSINAALQGGYEIKSVAMVDSTESKLVWSNDVPQTIITLEKGPAVLICVMATANWANAIADRFNNPALCQGAGPSAAQ
jgi:hypothetical protein